MSLYTTNPVEWQRIYLRDVWYPKNKLKKLAANKRLFREKWDYINNYKMEKGCADCGYKEHREALDFDHVTEEKNFALGGHKAHCMGWDKIKYEISICEVVCANCHRVRTKNRKLLTEQK